MRRETRYTLAGFVVFIYSFAFLVLLMISFRCSGNRFTAIVCTALIAALGSYFIHAHPKGIRLFLRLMIILAASTLLILLCWILLCEGTFEPLI